jgi:tetratricopeptide (TPR) repeat protein
VAESEIAQALDSARQHHRATQFHLAEPIYLQILTSEPNHPQALALLGMLYVQTNRPADAEPILRRAIAANPNSPDSLFNLGLALGAQNKWPQAAEAFTQSISLRPNYAPAHTALGNALRNLRKFEEAIAASRRAVELQPDVPGYWSNLGIAIQATDRYPEAIDAFRHALAVNPNYPDGWCNLSNALLLNRQPEESLEACRRAMALREDFPDIYVNLGNTLQALGDYKGALAAFERGLTLSPTAEKLHWNISLLLLLLAQYQRGWQEYEWRRRVPEFKPTTAHFNRPLWDGRHLAGKKILIHCEQGFGDTIHFARYLQPVAARGGKIIFHVQPPLKRLMAYIPDIQIVAFDEPIPSFDVHCPLLSLPHVLQNPNPFSPGPYLHAPAGKSDGKFKIGLVWSGKTHIPGRSIPLSMLASLADPRVQFHSLQVDAAAVREAQSPPPGMDLIDEAPNIRDFSDTAALMNQFDLIISIDTAAAQLAGALGRPTWVLLKFVPDWRWLQDRSDSPWYPTARLFRQKVLGDWSAPVAEMAAELKKLLDAQRP